MPVLVLFIFALSGCAGTKPAGQKRADALRNLGNSLVQQGNFRAGLENLLKAEQLEPDNANLQHELALVYRELGEYQLSLTHFKKALSLRPDFPEALNNLGTLYLLLGQWDLAIRCFQKAVDNLLYKTPYYAHTNMGLAYFNKGDYGKAIQSHQQALKSLPSFSVGHYNLARTYEAMKRWDDAIDAYEKAIFYDAQYLAAHLNLGSLYLKLGRKEEGARQLRLIIDFDPRGPYAKRAKTLLKEHGIEIAQ